MEKLKSLGWWLSFLCVCALLVLVSGHGRIAAFAEAHRDLAPLLALAVLLAIPGRVLALVAAFLLELLFVGWSRSSLKALSKPSASARLDLLSILVMLLLPQRYLGYLLSFGLLFVIDVYLVRHFDLGVTHFISLWALQILAVTLLQSFLRYWLHRMEHAIPALWSLHKFHHSADQMTMLTSARGTQFLKGVENGIVVLPMGLLASPTLPPLTTLGGVGLAAAGVYFAYHTFILINGYLAHSNLETDYGWVGRWLIVSPRMHRLHHARTPEYYDKNFSNDLVIWDRLFGTYARHDGAHGPVSLPIGLEDNPFNHSHSLAGSLREYFVTTFVVFWRELARGAVAFSPSRSRRPQAQSQTDSARVRLSG